MLKLYTHLVCPFAHRCRLLLAFKGLEAERVEVDLNAMPDWYREISPNQKVPLLMHGEHKIWESSIINEYLEEAFPEPALLPETPLERARVRLAIDFGGQNLIPEFYKLLRGDSQAAERLQGVLELLPDWMGPGPFWWSATPGLADAALYPWFERFLVLDHYRGFRAQLPNRVQVWLEALAAHPAVQAEQGQARAFVSGYARYVQPPTP